jgi:DNA polymerase III epsilon subunit family exonuclease
MMDRYLHSHTFVVVDVETTGISQGDRICEIGMTKIADGEIVDTFESLLNPEVSITNTMYHGIEDWMVEDAPVFRALASRIVDFMKDAVLVAHNAPFDMRFLRYEFRRIGTDLSHYALCTLKLSRRLNPEFPTHRLGYLVDRYDIVNEWHHRAGADADCSAKIFLRMQNKLETIGRDTLESLKSWGLPYDHRWCHEITIGGTTDSAGTLTRDDLDY